MLQLGLCIAIVLYVVYVTRKKSSKDKQEASGGGKSENFPFPVTTYFGESSQEENESNYEEAVVDEVAYNETVADEVTIIEPVLAAKRIEADEPMQILRHYERPVFEFDLRKAVIYSELMKPKYDSVL